MILRAIFWIGLVSLFMPHEPDLGFGRPGTAPTAAPTAPSSITGLIQAGGDVKSACLNHAATCAHSLSILDGFQAYAVRSLDRVRADISASRSARARSAL
jgi:hypothetical protein